MDSPLPRPTLADGFPAHPGEAPLFFLIHPSFLNIH